MYSHQVDLVVAIGVILVGVGEQGYVFHEDVQRGSAVDHLRVFTIVAGGEFDAGSLCVGYLFNKLFDTVKQLLQVFEMADALGGFVGIEFSQQP
jgi:hypothetical protein